MPFACNKLTQDEIVGIYLMKSYELIPGKCLVNDHTIVLQDTPFITNDEILRYSAANYQYTLTKNGDDKFRSLSPRTPLAIIVNKEIVFTGINVPPYVSSTCENSIVMTWIDSRKVRAMLGYTCSTYNPGINDKRNNAKLLSAFAAQGKLE